LNELIEAGAAKPIAVFTHHPPFVVTEGPDAIHFKDEHVMLGLRHALHRSGRVVAIFSGHVHRAVSGDMDGIPAMTVTATATTLRRGRYPAALKSRPVYHVHRYDPTWGVATETRIVRGLWSCRS
jgi:3',5'-cyclic AMP phosphodiesterase CpdA